ncbi:MAG TPA: hypothetical protein VJX92_05905 [Methylomirabilota bacterium]|nr:hypothetical protein [Methylomirabilota bacterium]
MAAVALVAALPLQALGDSPAVLAEVGAHASASPRLQHVFGGRTLSVPLVLYGTPGVRADLRARLVQLAPGLAAPAGEPLDIASDVDFSTGLRRDLSFDVLIPAVERESRFELTVFLRAPPSGAWRPVGTLLLRAYPNDLLKPLKRWTERQPLRLDDPSGKLERFLAAQGIAVLDLSARSLEKADGPVVTVLVDRSDDLARAKARARRGEAVVLLRERAGAFPRVERTRWGAGSLLVVELELLDRLPVDPQAQNLFLELLRSARSGETNREEDPRHEPQDPE